MDSFIKGLMDGWDMSTILVDVTFCRSASGVVVALIITRFRSTSCSMAKQQCTHPPCSSAPSSVGQQISLSPDLSCPLIQQLPRLDHHAC